MIAQCRGSDGPCTTHPFRMETRRSCRPLKQRIMREDGVIVGCEVKANRLLSLAAGKQVLAQAESADGADGDDDRFITVAPTFESLMHSCLHNAAEKDKRYEACFNDRLRDLTAACVAAKCIKPAAKCVRSSCRIEV